jgi:hypothetical protein
MRNKFLKTTVGSTAIALLLAASSAQAVLIDTFLTSGSNITAATASFSNAGLTLDVLAYVRDVTNVSSANVFTTKINNQSGNGGLGVDHRNVLGLDDDSNWGQIDNNDGYDEWLTFTSNGTIAGILMALFDEDEQIRIIGSNNANFLGGGCSLGSCFFDLVSDANPSSAVNGLAGDFDYFALNDTSYKYASVFAGVGGHFQSSGALNISRSRVRGVEVVPEPSVLALFGLGLIGLGFSARRKSTK